MGGRPLVALNLLGYPPTGLPSRVMGEILAGGAAMCAHAGCAVGGGHSVRDEEVKFGLSVTGLVHPGRILRNSTARAGDVLILTKPLGTGALVAALKKGVLKDPGYQALVTCMTTLNTPGLGLHALGATACTDVTGFGLVGHALEMAQGADLCFRFHTGDLPVLPDAVALCGQGFTCGGTQSNASHTAASTRYDPGVGQDMIGLVNDPQTSGGLLISIPRARAAALADFLAEQGALACRIVGEVCARSPQDPHLVFSA
jgi:selenide,water dikinase